MKYSGKIGFWIGDVEVKPGKFRPEIVEKQYKGDLKRKFLRWDSSGNQNDDLTTSNQIEIIADLYMTANFMSVRYVTFHGKRLLVKNVTIDYPKAILEIGGVYNGPSNASRTS